MLRRTTIVVCVLFLMSSVAAIASATTYTFTTLNPAGSDTQSCGTALALVGGVPTAVGYGGVQGGTQVLKNGDPASWNSAGTATNFIGKIPGSPSHAMAWGIDGTGDIVGNDRTASPNTLHAFFLASGGTSATILPILNSGDGYVAAFGVQSSSTVVGLEGSSYSSSAAQAVIWTKTGSNWGVAALPNLPGAAVNSGTGPSQANAINSAGIAAGWSNVLIGGQQYQDAVTWTNGGSGWVVNDLINRSLSQNADGAAAALAVNSSGLAVGSSSLATGPSFNTCAALFSGGSAILLGNFGGVGANEALDAATGINDSGVVVGYSLTGADVSRAFIWTPTVLNGTTTTGTFQDMNTMFASLVPSGWTLSEALGIDNNGDIVGYMTNNANTAITSGFLITASVPEPSSLLLIATGLVGLLACAWRKRK